MRGGFARFAVLAVYGAHVGGGVLFVGVAAAGELGGEAAGELFGGFVVGFGGG